MIKLMLKAFLILLFGFMCFAFGAYFSQSTGSGDYGVTVEPGIFDHWIKEDGTPFTIEELLEYYGGEYED